MSKVTQREINEAIEEEREIEKEILGGSNDCLEHEEIDDGDYHWLLNWLLEDLD